MRERRGSGFEEILGGEGSHADPGKSTSTWWLAEARCAGVVDLRVPGRRGGGLGGGQSPLGMDRMAWGSATWPVGDGHPRPAGDAEAPACVCSGPWTVPTNSVRTQHDRPDEDLHGPYTPTPSRHSPESPGDLSPGDQRDGLVDGRRREDAAPRIADGDNQARDRMVRANLRLVVNIARGYVGKGLALQDLIEEGNLGLLRAVEGFDPGVGTRFSTYASYWIKQSIKRALVNTAKPIRIPAYMVELLFKWRRMSADLQDSLGRSPTVEEIARALGLPKKKLAIVKKAIKVYNLVPQTDQPENGWSLGEMLMDERTRAPDVEMVEADNLKLVLNRLDEMDKREATVLRMRFGLNDAPPKTLKEIGVSLGLTRERVRQIENEALGKLSATFMAD